MWDITEYPVLTVCTKEIQNFILESVSVSYLLVINSVAESISDVGDKLAYIGVNFENHQSSIKANVGKIASLVSAISSQVVVGNFENYKEDKQVIIWLILELTYWGSMMGENVQECGQNSKAETFD